ncbi:MAG TPA: hypothetical protein VML19_14790 [Verrucomicrobiae bacterium]|nr:hypothetical protein [Verrucomicrobiae bacterium]
MPNFQSVPGGQAISNTTVTVNGGTLVVGLNLQDAPGRDLAVTNAGNDIGIFPGDTTGGVRLYTLRVSPSVLATRSSVTDTIMATDDLSKPPAAQFNVEFRFRMQPAHDLVVRDVTHEIFGVDKFTFLTGAEPTVVMSTFKPGDQNNAFGFNEAAPGPAVDLRVFAAKIGNVERTHWLMLPVNGRATSLMVVITHGFGQNWAYYSKLGFGNPMSKALLLDVRDRFVLHRWGHQVATSRSSMALLMPVRSAGGGGELGPFISQTGLGAKVVTSILIQADSAAALGEVDLVTFSSGIYDANTFIASGGRGLKFNLMVNQDPAGGTNIGGPARKQYLSGWTTGGPRAGFEFLPMPRWQNDPKLEEMKSKLGREYLHTWALPTYTLGMALR